MKYGLDFGTTNTSIATSKDGVSTVLPIDQQAPDPRVARTILYFLRREMLISNKVPEKRKNSLTFTKEEITYPGEQQYLFGQKAVEQYLADNKFRQPAVIRKILTGKWVSVANGAEAVQEYYLDYDFGSGRFIHSIKTALKSPFYKGTSIFGNFYTLEDLISTFIDQIKQSCPTDFQTEEVVVGRPVYFSDEPAKDQAAQDRLHRALTQAGFKKIRFVFEPVAAAQQYIASSGFKKQLVFVFDFGGGTLDTAIVQSSPIEFIPTKSGSGSDGKHSTVLAADGVYIGGDLLNADIVQAKLWGYFGFYAKWGDRFLPMPNHLYEALSSWYSIPNLNNPQTSQTLEKVRYKSTDPQAIARLEYLITANLGFDMYEAVEKAKKQLSTAPSAQIVFQSGPIDVDIQITKAEFEAIIAPRVEEIKAVIYRTLTKANVQASEIDVVVRTGGSSLIPLFEKLLIGIFGPEKIQQFETFTSIAAGLALVE